MILSKPLNFSSLLLNCYLLVRLHSWFLKAVLSSLGHVRCYRKRKGNNKNCLELDRICSYFFDSPNWLLLTELHLKSWQLHSALRYFVCKTEIKCVFTLVPPQPDTELCVSDFQAIAAQPEAPLMRFTSADCLLWWIVFKYIFSNYFLKCQFLMQMKHHAGKSKVWFVGVEREGSWEANQSLSHSHHLLCRVEREGVI